MLVQVCVVGVWMCEVARYRVSLQEHKCSNQSLYVWTCLYECMHAYVCVCVCVCLRAWACLCRRIDLFISMFLSVHLSVGLPIHPSVCPSVRPSVSLSIYKHISLAV